MTSTVQAIVQQAFKFTSRTQAFRFSGGTLVPTRVMLGDDGRYWVVSPANASRLERAGYEYAL